LDNGLCFLLGLLLLIPTATPLLPPVFNRLVRRLTLPFRESDAAPLPPLGTRSMFEGLACTTCGWFCLGASLWAVLQATQEQSLPWSVHDLARYTAMIGLSYVAGFLILVAPSGLGVREFFLLLFLTPEVAGLLQQEESEARGGAALAVVMLRLVWTTAELVVIATVYWLPGPAQEMSPGQLAENSQRGES